VFTPSGGASGWWRVSFIAVALIISAFPIFIFALAASPRAQLVYEQSPLAIMFSVPILILLVTICGFALIYVLTSIWRFLQAGLPHKNE